MGPKSQWPAALSLFLGFLTFSSAQTVNYSYDAAGRLVRASYPGGATISYTYDPAGNLLRREVTAGTPFTTVSSASFERGAPLAAEAIASGFGSGLARDVAVATSVPLPTELLGTRVEVADSRGTSRAALLFFVSPGQINYLIPAGTATGTARVTVTSGAGGTAGGTVEIERVAPALYTANARGTGVAAGVGRGRPEHRALRLHRKIHPARSPRRKTGEERVTGRRAGRREAREGGSEENRGDAARG